MRALVVAAVLSALSCSRSPAPTPVAPTPATPTPSPATASGDHGPAFLADDWQEALRRAKADGSILFVDAWAPWCHTCWSMKRDVLHQPALAAYQGRVTFVEIDTDRPQNAAFVARYPVRGWPTFFAVDPTSGAILAAQGGSMSLAETTAFLDRALTLRASSEPVDAAPAAGYRALQEGDAKAAAARFEEAAAVTGPRRTEAAAAAYRAWLEAKDHANCARSASAALGVVEGSAAAGDTAAYLVVCAERLPREDPARARALATAQATLEALVKAPAQGAAVDDRADVMINLAELYDEQGKKAEARALHEQRLRLLEDDARAADPLAARVHDYARMNSYLELGRGDEAVALFRARIAQLPNDYEAHARLATTLFKLERYDEARPAAERAVELAYGPRRLRYLFLLADVCGKRGDRAGERTALEQLVRDNDALDATLRLDDLAAKAKGRLAGGKPG
ncbi:MAG: thioredoxin family protein [Deltaproteobacteria bacterium]|nr:thioredoxin family protein [Deltaproteobacteria bacterium]